MLSEDEHKIFTPPTLTSPIDSHTPIEILRLVETAALAKSRLSWLDLSLKSFLGGIFISLGAGFDLLIAGGSPALRADNLGLSTLISALCFPVGFVLIMLTNTELCTSNMFVMPYAFLRRRISLYDLVRNLVASYVMNLAGCLLYAGCLFYWADALTSSAQRSYATSQARARVEGVNWGTNVSRGIMCNWLVALAFYLFTQGRDNTSKMLGVWIAITTFVAMGYQHSIANFFLVPVGMFYGDTGFGVGRFVWKAVLPVTLGNMIGGAVFGALAMWVCYGRHEPTVNEGRKEGNVSKVLGV